MQGLVDGQVLSQGDYQAFQQFLQEACGIVLGGGKEYLVSNRLGSLMRQYGVATVGELLRQLRTGANPRLRNSIIDAMTTNETYWFRDPAHYRLLREKILPELALSSPQRLRFWSAACSSGQEPYSMSMAVHEHQQANPGQLKAIVEILATDISSSMLDEARKGHYCGISVSRGLEPDQQESYFSVRGNCLEVRPEIKRRVSFREFNLTRGYELLGRFDVIFCRNVLIYFSNAQKQNILNRMTRILNPGGYLFLGSTESLAAHSHEFEMVSELGGIAYRLKAG